MKNQILATVIGALLTINVQAETPRPDSRKTYENNHKEYRTENKNDAWKNNNRRGGEYHDRNSQRGGHEKWERSKYEHRKGGHYKSWHRRGHCGHGSMHR